MKLPSYSDFNYLQKVNAKCPQIPDEKTKFCSVDKKILSFFLKHQKLFVKEAKLFFFIRNLRAFCIYFLQVLKIRIWGHLPSAGTFNQNLRAFAFYSYTFNQNLGVFTFYRYFPSESEYIFWKKFFPSGFEGISCNSVLLIHLIAKCCSASSIRKVRPMKAPS